jgi:hypothetical protein
MGLGLILRIAATDVESVFQDGSNEIRIVLNQDTMLIACRVPVFLSARQSVLANAVLKMAP